MHCAGKSQAVVRWSFAGEVEKTFTANKEQLPVNVVASKSGRIRQSIRYDFNGTVLTSYGFTVYAPPGISRKLPAPEIYLLSGKWDDHGSIGTYNTGYGEVVSYSGSPLLIGSGYSISGRVINEIRSDCYVVLSLEWRIQGCLIEVFGKSGESLLSRAGLCPAKFAVSCDDGCPKGYIRCETSQYPGYSCIPCSEIQSQLAAMRNQVKRLKNG